MSRGNILGNGNLFRKEPEQTSTKYTPPEERDWGSVLFNTYLLLKREETETWNEEGFSSAVETLESAISTADKLEPQSLISSLTDMLRNESDNYIFSRTMYLTAVVQALYNIGYNEFVIDVREWPEGDYQIGNYLHGTPDKHLTLELYGNFWWCGWRAENSNFTLYDEVRNSGYEAQNCTSDQMPNAKIENYWASKSKGNRLRRLNEKGEVTVIPTPLRNLYLKSKNLIKSIIG